MLDGGAAALARTIRSERLALHAWVACWFASCVAFNYSSKVSTAGVDPWDAVHAQLLFSVLLGGVALLVIRRPRTAKLAEGKKGSKSDANIPSPSGRWKKIIAAALLLLGANGCMMLSLRDSSVELFQTIKASSPIFTVIVCVVLLGKSYSVATYATLVPICAGFAMATYADIEATTRGVAYCVVSSILQIAINLLVKRLYEEERNSVSPLVMQFRINATAAAILTLARGGVRAGAAFAPARATSSASALPLLINGILYFSENVCAYGVNKRTAELPYSVIDTLRRLFIVIAAMVAFPKREIAATVWIVCTKSLGVVFVIAGSVAFRVNRIGSNKRAADSAV